MEIPQHRMFVVHNQVEHDGVFPQKHVKGILFMFNLIKYFDFVPTQSTKNFKLMLYNLSLYPQNDYANVYVMIVKDNKPKAF